MAGFAVPITTWLYQGVPAASGTVDVYRTTTTTHVTIYSDAGLSNPIANPLTLNSDGYAQFYVDTTYNLRLYAKTGSGAFIDDVDPVYVMPDIITSYAPLASPAFTGTPTAPTAIASTNNTQIATTAFAQSIASIAGDARNVVVKQTGNATATIAADEIIVETALGGACAKLASVSLTLNAAGTGANGLDTGALANSTFYYVYVIYNPSTATKACLATTAGSGATIYGGANMPSGYTQSALVGVLLTDGSAHFRVTTQYSREVFYQSALTVLSNLTPLVSSLTTQSLSASVPPIAKTCSGALSLNPAATTNHLQVAADSTGTGLQEGSIVTSNTVTNVTTIYLPFRQVPMITANTIFINYGSTTGSTTNSLVITGFTF